MESSYICPSLPRCCNIWALPIFCQWTNYAKIPMEVDTQWFRKSELGQIPKHNGLWLLCEWVGVSGHFDSPPSKGCFPAVVSTPIACTSCLYLSWISDRSLDNHSFHLTQTLVLYFLRIPLTFTLSCFQWLLRLFQLMTYIYFLWHAKQNKQTKK